MYKHGSWFLVKVIGEYHGVYNLVYGETSDDIRKRVFPKGKNAQITELTNRGLAELTGGVMPLEQDASKAAVGPIILHVKCRSIMIHG